MVRGKENNNEGFFVLMLWCGGCAVRGPEKGDHSDIPRVCYLRFKKAIGLQ